MRTRHAVLRLAVAKLARAQRPPFALLSWSTSGALLEAARPLRSGSAPPTTPLGTSPSPSAPGSAPDLGLPAPTIASVSPSNVGANSPGPTSAAPQGGYAPWEIRALVLALLPPAGSGLQPASVSEVLTPLPCAVQRQLQRHAGGLVNYCTTHFPEDVVIVAPSTSHDGVGAVGLQRRVVAASGSTSLPAPSSASVPPSFTSGAPINTAPPPPPLPACSLSNAPRAGANPSAVGGPVRLRTTIEILDALVEYMPTFFAPSDAIAMTLPSEIQKLYADTSFNFFMKRFKHYVDIRTNHGHAEMRLRPDFDHPKRGSADEHHGGSRFGRGFSGAQRTTNGNGPFLGGGASVPFPSSTIARPPRNSEANLIHYIVPRVPKEFTPLAEVLRDISDIVARHPSFDPRLGVTGLLEKYPEYFQLVDGRLRTRPHRSAPNALDDFDLATSPIPEIFAKVQAMVDAAAEGKNYLDETERAAAAVPTGKLYARLSAQEKQHVKEKCRSFPRFLRLHGHAIVVSTDNMRVTKFKPEYEPCAETILDHRLTMHAISPDDPILKIPAEMADDVSADWAVKELYDALPLTQCVELSDLLSLVPPAVRDALPAELPAIVSDVLDHYPDYFRAWRYPDDESVVIVQRAKVEVPNYTPHEIVRLAFPLIPQGGTDLESLRRRAPLPLQRFFHRHGLRTSLSALPNHFRIAGDRIIRLG